MILPPAFLLLALMLHVSARASTDGALVDWALPALAVTATDSAKWAVRAVSDGAGGLVVAWEENRGKRLCCRDTRDLYCQRIDAAGGRLWGDADYQLAAEADGEELEGMAPSPGGGALIIWRRGMGTLLVQDLDGNRRPLLDAGGRVVSATAGACEWGPSNCFAASADGTAAALVWGQPVEGAGTAIRVLRFSHSSAGWESGGITDVATEDGVHPGAVAAGGAGRWLVLVWREGYPVRLDGIWIGADGRTEGKRFTVGEEPAGSYLHVESSGDGRGGAWVVWASVLPNRMGITHKVRVASIERSRVGTTRVLRAEAGEARTQAMFIPPTMVAVGGQPEEPATPASVAWRATSLIAPAGPETAILARTDGVRMFVAGVRRVGSRLAVGASRALGGTVYTGCSPVLAPLAAGRVMLAWAQIAGSGWRLAVQRLVVSEGRVRDDGGPVLLEGPAGLMPRLVSVAPLGAGALGIAWSGHFVQEHGGVVARKATWRR